MRAPNSGNTAAHSKHCVRSAAHRMYGWTHWEEKIANALLILMGTVPFWVPVVGELWK